MLEELAGYAYRRYAIEPFHEEAKGESGWDQYYGRLWSDFHRHAVDVRVAYSLLVCLELRQRRSQRRWDRPCDPFFPSADLRRGTLLAVHREVVRWLRLIQKVNSHGLVTNNNHDTLPTSG